MDCREAFEKWYDKDIKTVASERAFVIWQAAWNTKPTAKMLDLEGVERLSWTPTGMRDNRYGSYVELYAILNRIKGGVK